MIHVTRDLTGDMARLECDSCHRDSPLTLIGQPRITRTDEALHWLRHYCGSCGWANMPSLDEGQPVLVDLCPRCARKVRGILSST